ncbi:hypothetical protein FOZ76_22020 [Verticiella sediminum]|uniref:Proteophosphoglycan ppg4 n=1 Tax=Verticiella sediminum TaxID=1247510 RepID=A0A556AC89_9BURK|nr:hypothetical protein [Verticiella sediminum]TSH90490.1 hypothetical protein FOZ76_22020 [Verticiella sediminum]
MQVRSMKSAMQAALGAVALAAAFGVSAQTVESSRSNPSTVSPPLQPLPNSDASPTPGQTNQGTAPMGNNTGNANTDPAMQPGTPVPGAAAPAPATPGTAGTESGSTDVTPTEPGAASDNTTRSN